MSLYVIYVGKLLGNKHLVAFFLHFKRHLQALVNAGADIACVVNKLNLSAVVTDKLAPFLAHRVGHNDNRAVALDRADKRKSDTLVSAGGFYDNAVLVNQALFFSLLNHIQRRARLD